MNCSGCCARATRCWWRASSAWAAATTTSFTWSTPFIGAACTSRPWTWASTPRRRRAAIFASLAEYDRESILEKTKAGQQLAAAQGKHIGRPKGLDAENLGKVKKALEKGIPVAETVELTGISLSSVKRYRKHLLGALT